MPSSSAPRHVHALFVHGVGAQSPLSSLLRPYQNIRAEVASGELPINAMDLAPGWEMKGFANVSGLQRLVLEPKKPSAGSPRRVYLYEVNYSELAAVIRGNHPVHIPKLFVGLGMAADIAALRLEAQKDVSPADRALAVEARGLGDALIASSVPVLGFLPLFARWSKAENLLLAYARFFEDVATFALDRTGHDLIVRHLDSTVGAIRAQDQAVFHPDQDRFVLAAHSLGSVVAHNFLVRNWQERPGAARVHALLTYGSPISLLCWLWLFIEHEGMDFARWTWQGIAELAQDAEDPTALLNEMRPLFIWPRQGLDGEPRLQPLEWVNVIDAADPIATRVSRSHAFMGAAEGAVEGALAGGGIKHVLLDRSPVPGVAHTTYHQHRPDPGRPIKDARPETTFNDVLLSLTGMRAAPVEPTPDAEAAALWARAVRRLSLWAWGLRAAGIAAFLVALRLGGPADAAGWLARAVMAALFLCGGVRALAFIQKLVWGAPTFRLNAETLLKNLPPYSVYRLRLALGAPGLWTGRIASLLLAGALFELPHLIDAAFTGALPHYGLDRATLQRVGWHTFAGTAYSLLFIAGRVLSGWRAVLGKAGLV